MLLLLSLSVLFSYCPELSLLKAHVSKTHFSMQNYLNFPLYPQYLLLFHCFIVQPDNKVSNMQCHYKFLFCSSRWMWRKLTMPRRIWLCLAHMLKWKRRRDRRENPSIMPASFPSPKTASRSARSPALQSLLKTVFPSCKRNSTSTVIYYNLNFNISTIFYPNDNTLIILSLQTWHFLMSKLDLFLHTLHLDFIFTFICWALFTKHIAALQKMRVSRLQLREVTMSK